MRARSIIHEVSKNREDQKELVRGDATDRLPATAADSSGPHYVSAQEKIKNKKKKKKNQGKSLGAIFRRTTRRARQVHSSQPSGQE